MTLQNEDALVNLYRDSFPDFARMVRRMGGTLEQARDSFHDAMVIYLEKESAGTLIVHTSPKAWLLGTARNCWLREMKRGSMLSGADLIEIGDGSGDGFEERESILLRSLQRSGQKCMELLKAFYYDHCSMEEIARRFSFKGRRSATVQKYKCLEKVREEVKTAQAYA